MTDALEQFVEILRNSFQEDALVKGVLSAPLKRQDALPNKQTLRPVVIKGQRIVQWELQFDKQQTHLNLTLYETESRIREQIHEDYREAYLFTSDEEVSLRTNSKGLQLKRRATETARSPAVQEHNRTKNYLIPEGEPVPFLVELGIMAKEGRVRKSRQKKFRQINRYLEFIDDIYPELPAEGTLNVVDFGCGLSYLTFALHHLLTQRRGRAVNLLGIDQKPSVIDRCTQLASALQATGMSFENGKIEESQGNTDVHLAISLHACDTATDAALSFAVKSQADVILAVPCCQHEVFANISNDELQLLLKHGIFQERFSTLLTDSLRAEALRVAGYRTTVMEFIDLEHTPKNVLIRGIKSKGTSTVSSESYDRLKQQFGLGALATDEIIKSIG